MDLAIGWVDADSQAAASRSNSFDLRACGGHDPLHDEIAAGDRTGFIHDNGFHVVKCFQRHAALEQDAALGACADARKIGQRYTEHQRARTGNDKEGQRGVYPMRPIARDDAGDECGQQCDADNRGCIHARKARDKTVDLGFARGSVLHAVQNALHHAFGQHMGDAQLEHAICVHAAGQGVVAGCDTHRHGLARDRGGIQTADALDHHAVKRHAVARADQYNVIYLRVGSGDGLGVAVRQNTVDRFRPQIDCLHDLAARTLDRAVLKIFANAVEQHNADRFVRCADRPCADGRQRHQKVFVEYTALADIAYGGQQHAPAEQQISCQHGDNLRHAG